MIPLRKDSSDRSEMVSQLLFGEAAEVIEEKDSWLKLKLEYDGYQGWVDRKQVVEISENEFKNYRADSSFVSTELISPISFGSGQSLHLVSGSTLPFFNKKDPGFSTIRYGFNGKYTTTTLTTPDRWIEFALLYLNAPYLWGGRSPFGIDCSGFTQIILKLCGVHILRDASQQAEQGQMINMIEESQSGDLAFFDNSDASIVHVGFILPDQQIIHASGKVRIDSLDHQGIYNHELKKYTHNLRLIKRFF